jgi:hypothetical protein
MQRKLALTAVLAVALAITGYAQKKDFSGTWTLDAEATAAAAASTTTTPPAGGGGGGGGRMGGGGGPMTIKQTADALTIETQGRQGPQTRTYKLDGSEQEIAMGQATVKAKAKWDGDKIAVELVRAGQDGTPTTSWTIYALDDKGQLWVENKTANGSRKSVYKKTT